MTPYEIACDEYYETEQDQSWSEFLTDHFRDPDSFVVSTPEMFVIARMKDHETLSVEAVAGVLSDLLPFIPDGINVLKFQRRNERVHVMPVDRLRCHKSCIER